MTDGPGAMPALTGYRYSVYTRSVAMALAEKSVAYTHVECDPFAPGDALWLLREHPFGRVPVLKDGGFRLWETAAILDYVAARFEGPALVPAELTARARMRQVISVADSYVYRPLVRQAFSHGVFRPMAGEAAAADELAAGLGAAPRVLDALEDIAREGLVLRPGRICLAACHLWPMLDYFTLLPEGRDMLLRRDALSAWAHWMGQQASSVATRPDLTPLQDAGKRRV